MIMSKIKPNFELICSSMWEPNKWIQPSDSDVYKSNADGKCYKFYPFLGKNTIESYHKLHLISQKKWEYKLQWDIFFTLEQLFWENLNFNECQIHRVEFWVLELPHNIFQASDIASKVNISVSELSYIEWQSLRDLFFSSQNSQQRDFIEELLKYMNIYYQKEFWLHMYHHSKYIWELNKKQLHGINVKIVWYENGTLVLTVTDLAKNIWEFVMNNKTKVCDIIN